MPYEVDEAQRIQRRISKCQRRIERGYVSPPGKETEDHRLARLQRRLDDLKPAEAK